MRATVLGGTLALCGEAGGGRNSGDAGGGSGKLDEADESWVTRQRKRARISLSLSVSVGRSRYQRILA